MDDSHAHTCSMFDFIAHRYDRINRILAMGMDIGWRKRMVHEIQHRVDTASPTSLRILDLATGTADVALLLSQAMPQAHIVGVDPSNHMLEQGRYKVQARQTQQQQQQSNNNDDSPRIVLEYADARDLQSWWRQRQSTSSGNDDERLFDAATMAFGIRNIPERDAALCQIHSVLRAGAPLAILEFSEPDPGSWDVLGHGARLFIRHVIPWLGGLLSGAPREYWHLQHSIQDFPKPADFVRLLSSVHCETGRFHVEDLIHMNHGSVQLYISRVERNEAPSSSAEIQHNSHTDSENEATSHGSRDEAKEQEL
jgi:demethylmenaquinone methyltransferase / 2-methoxy-6-polyprenyl-1,4-benzoquinol methylase